MAYRCINFRRICKGSYGKRLLTLSCLSVRSSVHWMNTTPSGRIAVKFHVRDFSENCGYATVLDKIGQRTGNLLEYNFIPMITYRTVICICNLDSLCFP